MTVTVNGTTGFIFPDNISGQLFSYESNLSKIIRPHFKAIHYMHTPNQAYFENALPDSTWTKLALTKPIYDNVEGLSLSTYEYIVKYSGTYLISGSANLSTISYYLLVLITIFTLAKNNYFVSDIYFIKIQIFLLLILFFFNFRNHVYLGDGGVYLLSFIVSVVVINFINNNTVISPYFGVLLLWYPCFENFFSIARRLMTNKNTYNADNHHLHHLIYLFFLKKNISYSNNLTGFILFSFNFIVLTLGYNFFDQTKYLIILIFFSIFIYCSFYLYLSRLLLNK